MCKTRTIISSNRKIVTTQVENGQFYVVHGKNNSVGVAVSGPFDNNDPRFSKEI